MANRIFRLSISPEETPDVRRVVDFDGRSSLDDVHLTLLDVMEIGADDHLYAFFLSGRFWDKESEYVDPRSEGRTADKALLFRLWLRVGVPFAYVFDFGTEQRFLLTLISISDVDAPLPYPVLVESVGDLRTARDLDGFDDEDDDHEGVEDDGTDDEDDAELPPPQIAALVPLAEAVLAQADALDAFRDAEESESESKLPEAGRATLRELGAAALALIEAIHEDLELLGAIVAWFSDSALILALVKLPRELASNGEVQLALRVAEAFRFSAPDDVAGEIALIYAKAGQREEALARVAANLEGAVDRCVAECKAGDVYHALGEDDAAEAYYRRSLVEAKTESDRSGAVLRIASFLLDTGREVEAAEFVAAHRRPAAAGISAARRAPAVTAGRNDPCPCGSGKKYKKCHGA